MLKTLMITLLLLGGSFLSAANVAPLITSISTSATTIAMPNRSVSVSVVATDLDGPKALTYSWARRSGPGTVTFVNGTTATANATFGLAGIYVLQVNVSDGAASTTSTVTVTVTNDPSNVAPVVDAGVPISFRLSSATKSTILNPTVSDDGKPFGTLAYAWSKTSGPGTVTFSNAATLKPTVTFSMSGTYTLTLTVNDGDRRSSDVVTVVVDHVVGNVAPIVEAGPATTVTLPTKSLVLSGNVSDDTKPYGVLNLAWSKTAGAGGVTFSNSRIANPTVTFTHSGDQDLKLLVDDGDYQVFDTVRITVAHDPNNVPPVVSAGPNLHITSGNTAVLNGTVTDAYSPFNTWSYSWSKVSGPGNVSFTPSNKIVDTTATFSANGVYVLKLFADDQDYSASATCSVIVGNVAPVANAQTITTNEDTPKAITLTATDVNNDPLTFVVTTPPTKGTFTGTAPNLTYVPNLNANGSDSFKFKANDGLLDSAIVTVNLTITAVNDLPTISAIADRVVNVGQSTGAIAFTVGDAETSVNSLTLGKNSSNLTLVPLTNIVLGGSGASRTVTVTPVAGQSGQATITITVTDGNAGTTSRSFVLKVGTIPVITTQPGNVSKLTGQSASFAVIASGIPTPSYQWQSAPNGSSVFTNISGANAASYTTPTLVASDNGKKYRVLVSNILGTATSTAAVLTVTALDAKPVITVANVNTNQANITINATITDDKGVPTIAWSLDTANAVAAKIDNPSAEDPVVHLPVAGTYKLNVIATDNANQSSTAAVIVTVSSTAAVVIKGKVLDAGVPASNNGVQLLWVPLGSIIQATTTLPSDGSFQFSNLVDVPTNYQVMVLPKP